jgi:hypothetical protein
MTDKSYTNFSKELLKQPKPVALALMHFVERHPNFDPSNTEGLFVQASIDYLSDLHQALSIMMSKLGGDNDDKKN